MKKVIILSALLGFVLVSQAQTFEDAVQFSRTLNWGTARSAVWREPSGLWEVICLP